MAHIYVPFSFNCPLFVILQHHIINENVAISHTTQISVSFTLSLPFEHKSWQLMTADLMQS
jgi:hypothetical protein